MRPTLDVAGVPAEAIELAMICHDPDAPIPRGFTHWTVYAIPPGTDVIGRDGPGRDGPNSLGESGYTGPNPPSGHGVHHYYFWVYALDRQVSGTPTREEFLEQYGESIVEQNRVVGTYTRT